MSLSRAEERRFTCLRRRGGQTGTNEGCSSGAESWREGVVKWRGVAEAARRMQRARVTATGETGSPRPHSPTAVRGESDYRGPLASALDASVKVPSRAVRRAVVHTTLGEVGRTRWVMQGGADLGTSQRSSMYGSGFGNHPATGLMGDNAYGSMYGMRTLVWAGELIWLHVQAAHGSGCSGGAGHALFFYLFIRP